MGATAPDSLLGSVRHPDVPCRTEAGNSLPNVASTIRTNDFASTDVWVAVPRLSRVDGEPQSYKLRQVKRTSQGTPPH
jgi:hypothetical protein